MTLVATELFTGGNTTLDTGGDRVTRPFRVKDDADAGATVAQVLGAPGLLPAKGNTHPEYTELVVQSVSAFQEGQTVRADVSYGLPAFNDRPPVDFLEDGFLSVDVSFRTEAVEIPIFTTQTISLTSADGEDAVEKTVWRRLDSALTVDKTVITNTVRLSGELTAGLSIPAALALATDIEREAGKLHLLAGQYRRFVPNIVRQESSGTIDDPAKWRIEYTWETDPGIVNDFNFTAQAGPNLFLQGAYAYPFADENFIIPPFSALFITPDPSSDEAPPIVQFRDRYLRNDFGWASLPGVS